MDIVAVVVIASASALVLSSTVPRAEEPTAVRAAREAWREAAPIIEVDEALADRPVVAVRFRPNDGRVTDDRLVHLKTFPEVQIGELTNKQPVDPRETGLKDLPELEDLDLDRTLITDAGLEYLKPLRKLRHLQFAHTRITDIGLPKLGGLPALRDANAVGTQVTRAGAEALKKRSPKWKSATDRSAGSNLLAE
jgi:hypothetical protein